MHLKYFKNSMQLFLDFQLTIKTFTISLAVRMQDALNNSQKGTTFYKSLGKNEDENTINIPFFRKSAFCFKRQLYKKIFLFLDV